MLGAIAFLSIVVAGTCHAIQAPRITQALDKPVLDIPLADLSEVLLNHLLTGHVDITRWTSSLTVDECVSWFDAMSLDVKYLEIYHVTYEECPNPKIMCPHRNAPYEISEASRLFGHIPIGMRNRTRYLIALPATNHGGSATVNDNNNIILQGKPSFHDMVATVAKSLASNGYRVTGNYYENDSWFKAYAADCAVSNNIAHLNQIENLAQETVAALVEVYTPGGLGGITKEWEKISRQVSQIQKDILPGTLKPILGGEFKCSVDLPDPITIARRTAE